MGLATSEGIWATTTEHYDLSPATQGTAPMVPSKAGGSAPAPDIVLFDPGKQIVVAVEVEARTELTKHPGSTAVEFVKLRSGTLVDISSYHYARVIKGKDFDDRASWGHKSIHDILDDYESMILDRISLPGGNILIVVPGAYLETLESLWVQFRDGRR
jgi:hypothetical protein